MDRGTGDGQFTQALADLKRRGSNLLVVGAAGTGAHLEACSRLLGAEADDRERLLVCTECAEHLDERLGEADPASVHVVGCGTLTRSAADHAGSPVGPRTTHVPAGDIDALRSTVATEIDAYGGLEPARLRVCVDSLRPMLDDHDRPTVTGFLETVTGHVSDAGGMGHYHLAVAIDDPRVEALAPLFDAVVEVRADADGTVHRWHLDDPDLTTDWIAL